MDKQVTEGYIEVDPGVLLADDNARFGLKKYRIESLAADIEDKGGIMVPIEVTPLANPANGKLYKVNAGHYRLAAAEMLIKEGHELKVPALVVPEAQPVDRLKRQLAENMERENQSPMDQAVAIKRLMDHGVSRQDIRGMFAIPGGRKGLAMQPASNSFINMRLSFLKFPKPIQEKIHDGRLSIVTAYALSKQPRDKWDEILEKAEQARIAEIEREEKADEKLESAEQRQAEREAKEAARLAELEAVKAAALEASKAADAAAEEADRAYKAAKALKGASIEARKVADDAFEAKKKLADKAAEDAAAAKEKREAAEAKAAERVAKERAKEKAERQVKPGDIKRAAGKDGGVDANGRVKLNMAEMREVVENLWKPSAYPKVQLIGQAFQRCFDSLITDRQLMGELAVITGEKKVAVKAAK